MKTDYSDLAPTPLPRWIRRSCVVLGLGGGCLTALAGPLAPGVFSVRESGALGDGRTIDTAAINAAISRAAAAGGGKVDFPAGTYLSYSIRLQSNITLYLEPGSTIVAAEPAKDLSVGYDAPEPNPGADQYEDGSHSHWHNSLIWGDGLKNVSIVGPGRIFGRGLSRRNNRRDLLPEERRLPVAAQPDLALPAAALAEIKARQPGQFGYPDGDAIIAGVGDKAIALKNCVNVTFRDFTLYHGGHLAILVTGVDNLTIDNLKVDTNRDGIDIDCCRFVNVANCFINAPKDDGLCLKSSGALGYSRPTAEVAITNCQLSGFDEGTYLDGTRQRGREPLVKGGPTGRIKLGTEGTGGFRNIAISNCVFTFGRGLAFESVDGGLMENITVSNIVMEDIVNAPIFIRLGARLRGPRNPPIGTARRIKVTNLVANRVTADHGIILAGLPGHPVEDVELSHILIRYLGGGHPTDPKREIPEMADWYPDPTRFGVLPAYGLFARHVKNLSLDHVELRYDQPDRRSPILLEDVAGADFEHLAADHLPDTPVFVLKNVSHASVHQSADLPDGELRPN